ncbi:MAG: hypothetical protein J1E40_04505 [Oscillospiraceae bacterium]|nr:hypothetical protein [Oscillospiraceae bacterium]
MYIGIECEYCGSSYDYSESHTCPNCGAVPDKKQVIEAKRTAKEEEASHMEVFPAYPAAPAPTGKLMRTLIKLIPVWIVLIVVMLFVPGIKETSDNKLIMESLRIIDSPEYTDHQIGDSFLYDNAFTVTVDDFFYSDSAAVDALLPEGYRLLVVHIVYTYDGEETENNYYDVTPYITDGKICRAPVSSSALRSLPDVFAQNAFYFNSYRYDTYRNDTERYGFLCFIVDEDTGSFDLCFEETHLSNYVRQLDCIHRVSIDAKEG